MDIQDTAVGAAKVAPPAAVAVANTAGMTVPELINVLTLIYVAGLVIGMLWRFGVKVRGWLQERRAT